MLSISLSVVLTYQTSVERRLMAHRRITDPTAQMSAIESTLDMRLIRMIAALPRALLVTGHIITLQGLGWMLGMIQPRTTGIQDSDVMRVAQ